MHPAAEDNPHVSSLYSARSGDGGASPQRCPVNPLIPMTFTITYLGEPHRGAWCDTCMLSTVIVQPTHVQPKRRAWSPDEFPETGDESPKPADAPTHMLRLCTKCGKARMELC